MHRLRAFCAAAAVVGVASPAQSQGYATPPFFYRDEVYISGPWSYGYGYSPGYPSVLSPGYGLYDSAWFNPYSYVAPAFYPYSLTPIYSFQNPAAPFLALTFNPLPLRYQVPGGRSRVIGATSGDLVAEAKRQLQVTGETVDEYHVRWTGPREAVTRVEVEAIGSDGKTLDSLVLTGAPFAGSLRVPVETTAVVLSVRNRDGSSAGVKLPVEQFRALAPRREPDCGRGTGQTG